MDAAFEFDPIEPTSEDIELLKTLLLHDLMEATKVVYSTTQIVTLNGDDIQNVCHEDGYHANGEQIMPSIKMLKAVSDAVTEFIRCSRHGTDIRESLKRVGISLESFADVYLRFCRERKSHFHAVSKKRNNKNRQRFRKKIEVLNEIEGKLLVTKARAGMLFEATCGVV